MYQAKRTRISDEQLTNKTLKQVALGLVIIVTLVLGGLFWFMQCAATQGLEAEPLEQNPSTPQNEWQKGQVPALYQFDTQWSEYPYAGAQFSISGCGPINLTMAYIALTGDQSISPTYVADIATAGGFTSADGTDWLFMIVGAEELGLSVEQFVLSEEVLDEYLSLGLPVICIMGEGDFTSSGHFILISGANEDGTYSVRDSNSIERTQQSWSFETLYSQHLGAWVYWV